MLYGYVNVYFFALRDGSIYKRSLDIHLIEITFARFCHSKVLLMFISLFQASLLQNMTMI